MICVLVKVVDNFFGWRALRMRKRVGKTRHGKEGGEVVHLVACQLYLALGYRTCSDIVVEVDDKVAYKGKI